ncbi:MAG TPA: hypothetical protein VGL57_06795 [Solirubrobacteraceae bacterium]|jgi:hypothetical protein
MITKFSRTALLCCPIVLLLAAWAGVASAATPLTITHFSMETISGVEESVVAKFGPEPEWEFTNHPERFTQAGGHPWALVTKGEFASEPFPESGLPTPTRDPKDIVTTLPAGLLGNPEAVPQCPLAQVSTSPPPGARTLSCPAATQVGTYEVQVDQGNAMIFGPIINVTPAAGESAEFAFENSAAEANTPLLTAHLVYTAGGYAFTVSSNEIPELGIGKFEVTFWGVPANSSHDAMRGRFCRKPVSSEPGLNCDPEGGQSAGIAPLAFLSWGSNCAGGPLKASLRADSWQEPGSVHEGQYLGYTEATATLPALTGCSLLSFPAGLVVEPDTTLADAPVGLTVGLTVPQDEAPEALATPHLRNAVVTLPAGMSISPGIVDGIQACNESGAGGINFEGRESEEVGLDGELHLAPGHCPGASTVGTAEAVTPLLPAPVRGHVYLARPKCGGVGEASCTNQDALDGNLYQLYLELGGTGELGDAGIIIKAHGYVEANPATGQLTAKFSNNPQAPFSELRIHLNGGPRAPLDNPATCGPATTNADLTPWSAPGLTPEGLRVTGTPDATPSSFFEVEGCASSAGLRPGFTAGTVSAQAGTFSSFTMNLTRQDREQFIKGVQLHTPPGLLGMLASVPLCGEQQADAGTCPEASKIGTTRVASGAGSHPFEIEGNVYLTTGYDGAPFGLSIVTNVVAGPFNLGLVVVRARVAVNPTDSSLTITTDETGPYAIPQIVFGVPLRLKQITVNIDRPNFMFNPTNCEAQHIAADISGSQNAVAAVASSFAAGGCKSLQFKPTFQVFTSGKTSKVNGASLDAKVSYPPFKAGSEANIAKVKVELPRQLPSRLTTLQKACTASQFESNPAGCPAASVVGIVRATTPLLPVELTGPVYFVSHGGEAFPSLLVVLQGDGVRVDLTGSTFISQAGITSSSFKTVPDVPVSAFELYLPEGKYSALAANGDLCRSKLTMPTEFVAQNGVVIRESTKIKVTACPKAKKAKAKRQTKKTKAKKISQTGSGRAR